MKMSNDICKFAAVAFAVAILLPTTAHAYPKQGWYMGVGAGANFLQDIDAKVGAVTNTLESDPGFMLDGSVGYGFESQLRPEFEIAYRRNTIDKTSGTGAGAATGNMHSVAFMGNLMYDFQTQTGLTPYLGAGLGGALVTADNAGRLFNGATTLTNEPFLFAYQGIAGLSYELSENVDITADYRYFATLDPDYKTSSNLTASEGSYRNHAFLVGLRYIFGEEKELPTPVMMRSVPRQVTVVPAQPMMMPRPVMVQQQPMQMPPPPVVPETYIVFFDFDKTYLTSEAKETIQRAADAYRRGGVARVEVTGHTDTRGSSRYNKRLSDRRAKMVEGYMESLGIPRDEITTRGAGESQLMVPTSNNVREAKNRRAEIVLRQQQ